MSLFLGKTGERLIRFRLAHKPIDNVVMRAGKVLSFMTGGMYKPGLTALAYQMSQQLSAGDRITIMDGRIIKDGKVISESDILRVGRDMGEITVREAITTPKGFRSFYKNIYLEPERWGVTISDKFTPEQKDRIRDVIDVLNMQFLIKPDNALSLRVEKGGFIHKFIKTRVDFLFYGWMAYSLALIWSEFDTGISLGSSIATGFYLAYHFVRSNDCASTYTTFKYSKLISWNQRRVRLFIEDETMGGLMAHEYAHFLKDFGAIKNDVVADTCYATMSDDKDEAFWKGYNSDLLAFVSSKQIMFPWEKKISYDRGRELAGLAWKLSTLTHDPYCYWSFVRIVADSTSNEQLIEKLMNSQFWKFFDPGTQVGA